MNTSVQTVYEAIKVGYRLLDGACDYGNEKEAGEGVRRAIQDGLVKREDLCEFSCGFQITHFDNSAVITTKAGFTLNSGRKIYSS